MGSIESRAAQPMRPGVLVLGGATASGKTRRAIDLAVRFDAEIVGADSRQIYRDMPVGTAAPTPEQLAAVPHHLIGFLDPRERYSAARFVTDAVAAIQAIRARGKHAIVVGGTGFYLRTLCGDVALGDEPDAALRARLVREARAHPPDVLHAWLRARNPDRAGALAPLDGYRVMRALEIELAQANAATVTRRDPTPARREQLPTLRALGIPYRKVVLAVEPATLAARIAARTDAMLATGLVDEARRIGADAVAADAVGYRDALAYDAGLLTGTELRTLLARMTRRYAKRQLTWFRSERECTWIAPDDEAAFAAVAAGLGWQAVARTGDFPPGRA